MRQVIILGVISLISCGTPNEKTNNSYYVESKLSFYDPYDNSFTVNKWIRKPENIRIAHESFKKFGYDKLLTDKDLIESPCWIPGLDGWVQNKTCKDIIDSLIVHYPDISSAPKYYKDFWTRRFNEGNASAVYEVLRELKAGLFEKGTFEVRENLVNDTIVNLLGIQEGLVTDESAVRHFDYLKSIGLNNSAHNLLYERYDYYKVKWDREKLDKSLKKDTVRCCPRAVFEDDTK